MEAHLTQCENCRQQIESAQSNITASYQSDSVSANKTTIGVDEYPTKSIPEVSTPPPDTHIPGKDVDSMLEGYQILEELPRGGQAVVYKAIQKATKRTAAVKVLLQGAYASAHARYRFEREVELAASLQHPNIVTIYDSGITRGQYYFAMEYIQGKPLDQYVRTEELSTRETMAIFNKVCSVVVYAHQHGVMHRDLKPGNILVDADGEPHILDFGLAKLTDTSEQVAQETVMTSIPGKIIGTLAFMSPEQASGQPSAIDVRTDVYSLGVILFNVLTNQWPYDISGSQYEVLKNIQEQEPIRPSKIIPRFDTDIEAILLKALAKEPSERYQSITELANDIHCWLQGLPIIARSVNTLYLLRKLITRHRTTSIITGLLLVIIVNTSFISLYSYGRARSALKKSQSMQQVYQTQSKRNRAFANQVVFTLFLELWHDEKIKRSQGTASNFASESRERAGALFLLDPRELTEKEADFRGKFSHGQASFWMFLLGEYHLKNKNKSETIEAYKQCIEEGQISELDDWFRNRAKRKLNELLNEKIPLESRCSINGNQ